MRELAREPMPGEIRLQWWRDVLGGAGRGEVDAHPVAAALRDVVVRYRLPPRTLLDLIDARSFDLYDEPMASLSYLERYADADLVGADRACGAHSLRRPRYRMPAISPGMPASPMRSPGLLRALPIHAARGQLYLPADLMQRYGARSRRRVRRQRYDGAARGAGGAAAAWRGIILARRAACSTTAPPERRAGAAAGRAGAAGARPHGAAELSAVPAERAAAMAAAMDAVARGAQRACAKRSDAIPRRSRAPPIH